MRKYMFTGLGVAFVGALVASVTSFQRASAHCQIPCGIYDDPARIQRMLEDTTTITKAIDQINELSGKDDVLSRNQTARWIVNKEEHASHIISVVAEYFLTQKLKEVEKGQPGYDTYVDKLAAHHRVMRAAMKTKQTVDPAAADALQHAIRDLASALEIQAPRSGS